MYEKGAGVRQNDMLAYEWYAMAGRNVVGAASGKLGELVTQDENGMRFRVRLIVSGVAAATLGGCALLTPMKVDTPDGAIQIAIKSCMTDQQDSHLVWSADYWFGMWHVQATMPSDSENAVYKAVVWRNGHAQGCAVTVRSIG